MHSTRSDSTDYKPTDKKYGNTTLGISEAFLSFTAVIGLMWVTELIPGFESWQRDYIGKALFSALLYMALPGVVLFYLHGKSEKSILFTKNSLVNALKVGGKSLTVMLPATFAFPIAQALGYGFKDWGGAAIITGFYLLSITAMLWMFRKEPTTGEPGFSRKDSYIIAAIFLSGFGLAVGLNVLNTTTRDLLIALIFIGLMEEFFFRGYLQPRLNMVFGKPFEIVNLKFGWGLIITAVLFGLIHVISPGDPLYWSWGFWTFISGLAFGVIREKSGSFLAPALVHGLTMMFPVFFS